MRYVPCRSSHTLDTSGNKANQFMAFSPKFMLAGGKEDALDHVIAAVLSKFSASFFIQTFDLPSLIGQEGKVRYHTT